MLREIMDGAYGTLLYDESRPSVLPEEWNIIDPCKVGLITREYLNSGASIIKTNTFNCGPRWDSKYNWESVIEAAYSSARLNDVCEGRTYKIAASIGPQKYSMLSGDNFDDVVSGYNKIATVHLRHRPDFILLETQIEARVVRAALIGINNAIKEAGYSPEVIVNVCIKPTGVMQDGSNVESVLNMALVMGASYVGINCSSGSEIDLNTVRVLSNKIKKFVWCPNNGMPDENGNYNMKPSVWAEYVNSIKSLAIVGGCCGTTPSHIGLIKPINYEFCPVSEVKLFDEKFNIFGSKLFRQQIKDSLYDDISTRMQDVPSGVGLDINLDDGIGDEFLRWKSLKGLGLISLDHPIMIDSDGWKSWMEFIYKECNGLVYFNSIIQSDNTQELINELNVLGIVPILRPKSQSLEDEDEFNKEYSGYYLKDASVQVFGVNGESLEKLNRRIENNRTVIGISNATFTLRGTTLRKEATEQVFNNVKKSVEVVIGPEYLWNIIKADQWINNPTMIVSDEEKLSDEELSIIKGDGWESRFKENTKEAIRDLTEILYKLGESFSSGRASILHLVEAGKNANKLINLIPKENVSGKQVIIATVEGDLHDIGKNITKLLLESAGFQVLDLGIDVKFESILNAINDDTVAIAMSGLIAQSLLKMKQNVKELRKFTNLPIFLGGAVVSDDFVRNNIEDENTYYTTDGLSMASFINSL